MSSLRPSDRPTALPPGFALLEVLIALTILATAGLSVVALVDTQLRAAAEVREREATMVAASRVMAAMTLLKREELDIRLGTREVGEFLVEVQRPEPRLYRIGIRERRSSGVDALVTVVHKP